MSFCKIIKFLLFPICLLFTLEAFGVLDAEPSKIYKSILEDTTKKILEDTTKKLFNELILIPLTEKIKVTLGFKKNNNERLKKLLKISKCVSNLKGVEPEKMAAINALLLKELNEIILQNCQLTEF